MTQITNAELLKRAVTANNGRPPFTLHKLPRSHLRLLVEKWLNGNYHVVLFNPMGVWRKEIWRSISEEELARVLYTLQQHRAINGKTYQDVVLFIRTLR